MCLWQGILVGGNLRICLESCSSSPLVFQSYYFILRCRVLTQYRYKEENNHLFSEALQKPEV